MDQHGDPATSPGDLPQVDLTSISSVQDAATAVLRDAILAGKLSPGQRLVQHELAATLGMSRQPIRDALRRLESEGLVVRVAGRGSTVRPYNESEIADIYRFRSMLEPEAARLAASRVRPTDLRLLEQLNGEMEDASAKADRSLFVELNARFHRVIHAAAGSATLLRLMEQLWVGWAVASPLYVPGRMAASAHDHRTIIDALRGGDPDEARVAMAAHLDAAWQAYRKADN